jgi:hypothetical protein
MSLFLWSTPSACMSVSLVRSSRSSLTPVILPPSRSPLAIPSIAVASLPLQNQTGVSHSMRWCSGNGGMEERAVLSRRESQACTRSSKAVLSRTEKVVDRSCLSRWYACG